MTSYGRRAFSYAGPHAWNSLPEHLRQTTSIELFKRSLKRFYSGSYRAQRIRDIPVKQNGNFRSSALFYDYYNCL